MNLIRKLFGAKSKYDKTLPYTYEARIYAVEGDEEEFVSCVSDTICGLIDYIMENEHNPVRTKLFEIYTDKEIPIPEDCFLSEDGKWLPKEVLCERMTSRYGEARTEHNCQFRDREQTPSGPMNFTH